MGEVYDSVREWPVMWGCGLAAVVGHGVLLLLQWREYMRRPGRGNGLWVAAFGGLLVERVLGLLVVFRYAGTMPEDEVVRTVVLPMATSVGLLMAEVRYLVFRRGCA